jgi:hypothetical protein
MYIHVCVCVCVCVCVLLHTHRAPATGNEPLACFHAQCWAT